MKMVINGLPLMTPLTGVGRYTQAIATGMRQSPDDEVWFHYGYYSRELPGNRRFLSMNHVKKILSRSRLAKKLARRVLGMGRKMYSPIEHFDLYWEPNFVVDPTFPAHRRIATVHDFSFALYPQWHPSERVEFFRQNFWKNIELCDAVITVSHRVKEEAIELLKIPEERIHVIYNGVDHDLFYPRTNAEIRDFRDKWQLPERFILFVGSVEPRKNLVRLMRAYRALPWQIQREWPLIVAGAQGWENHEIKEEMHQLQGKVRYMGYMNDLDLAMLYNAASVFVYPSIYEGFGIPPLEAMASGTPVLTSEGTAMEEICQSSAAYCDPNSEESIRDGLIRMITDEAYLSRLRENGLDHVQLFSWNRSIEEHRQLFSAVV